MVLNLRKVLKSFLLAAVLVPAIAFANTEFKGTETVNINRADAATLAAYLKGVGANKAKDIVRYRNANGKFKSIEDIKNVPGVGDETFKDNKRKMSTSRGKSVAPEGYKLGQASGKSKKTSTSKSSTKKSTSTKKSSASSKDGSSSSSKLSSSSKSKKTTTKKRTTSNKSKTDKKSSTKKKSSKSSSNKKIAKKSKAKKPKKKAKKSTAKKKK